MADVTDIDCLSCGYEIRDFAQAASVMCGHGFIHYNCSYLWVFFVSFLAPYHEMNSFLAATWNAEIATRNWRPALSLCSCVRKSTKPTRIWKHRCSRSTNRLRSWSLWWKIRRMNRRELSRSLSKCVDRHPPNIPLISLTFRELQAQLKAKDEKILSLQKEVYEMKLERVDFLKQELTEKLNSLKTTWCGQSRKLIEIVFTLIFL